MQHPLTLIGLSPSDHYILPAHLAAIIDAGAVPRHCVIADVRGYDFGMGGQIRGAFNFPAENGATRDIANMLATVPLIVCHCQYSKQRGPAFARQLERQLHDAGSSSTVVVLTGGYGGFRDWCMQNNRLDLLAK